MKKCVLFLLMAALIAPAAFARGQAEHGAALQPISSEDCPAEYRGSLDAYYCDKTGDMVADLPDDDRSWQDPETLFFAYTPVEDPVVYEDVWEPFLEHLSEVTGREVRFFIVDSYTAQVEAMRSGRLHVAGISTGPTPFAVNLAGFVPAAIMADDQGEFGYTLQVYVPHDSEINSLAELQGKRVAHVSPTSNSGHLAPMALFSREGIMPGEDYEIAFSGSHENSILGVIAGDYDAAPVGSEIRRLGARGLFDLEDVRIIHETDPFPTTAYGFAHNLHPDLQHAIREAFLSYEFEGTTLAEEYGQTQFIPITYEQHWAPIRAIQEFNEIVYRLEDIDG